MEQADLVDGAAYLITRHRGKKPKQADLRRAQSALYYALFHTLAKTCADLMIGGKNSDRSRPAWKQVYRALDHGHVSRQCRNGIVISKFPKQIEDFAGMFVSMQEKRHLADYDPFYRTTNSEAKIDLEAVKIAIGDFLGTDVKDKRAFAAWVLLKSR